MAFENDPEGYHMACGYAGRDFDKVREVTHRVMWEYSFEYTLSEFQNTIAAAIQSIPEQYRADAKVELAEGYDSGSRFTISYVGPESESVVAERVRRCEEYVAASRAAERRTYEVLKNKFEQGG